jgi:hypothetical protein
MNASHPQRRRACPNILGNHKIVPRSFSFGPWKHRAAEYGRVYGTEDRVTKGSTTLEIAALGMAVAYLLVLLTVAVGALWVLVWLFRETPGALVRTGRESVDGARSALAASERGACPRLRSSPNAPSTRPRETTSGRSLDQDPASSAQALRQNYGRAAQRKGGRTEGRER